ncbi:MAG: nucleoside transporter C-terminal domain-containing protein [Acidobacteriota bacterium]
MIFQSLLGIFVIFFLAWMTSENRHGFPYKIVFFAAILQAGLAILLFNVEIFRVFFSYLNRIVTALEESTMAGATFAFGYLGGGPAPFEVTHPEAVYILAFRGLLLLLVISALSSLLFYWKILPLVVRGFSAILEKALKIGGAEGLAVSSNIFLGMVEAPLLIRPYLVAMTRSELFTVMTCGMATIAGTMMILYASILGDILPGALGHILTASIINAPAAVAISKIIIPETEPLTPGKISDPDPASNFMDAISKGTMRGISLLLNITAMLVVLIALVKLANITLGVLPDFFGGALTLERILGLLMTPLVWLMGVPLSESLVAGDLLGTKIILNELVAYLKMSQLPAGALSERSITIMAYGMCGFANLGSLGIMIGGIGTMVEERRSEIVSLGFKSLLAGTLATCLTGTIVGILVLW